MSCDPRRCPVCNFYYLPSHSRNTIFVAEFHEKFGAPIRMFPGIDVPEVEMRVKLIEEELREFKDALAANDVVEVADALGDLLYVVHGAALTFGIPLDAVVAEIHHSNMTKLGDDGKPIYREDGKILKGPRYEKPNIRAILFPGDELTEADLAESRAAFEREGPCPGPIVLDDDGLPEQCP